MSSSASQHRDGTPRLDDLRRQIVENLRQMRESDPAIESDEEAMVIALSSRNEQDAYSHDLRARLLLAGLEKLEPIASFEDLTDEAQLKSILAGWQEMRERYGSRPCAAATDEARYAPAQALASWLEGLREETGPS